MYMFVFKYKCPYMSPFCKRYMKYVSNLKFTNKKIAVMYIPDTSVFVTRSGSLYDKMINVIIIEHLYKVLIDNIKSILSNSDKRND